MISNGYLFNDDTIKEAKEEWQLTKVQITLDGTEQIYNRCKAYIYKDVNAYRRVIGNIHLLQDADIHVNASTAMRLVANQIICIFQSV